MAYRDSVEVLRARVARMERERDELREDVAALKAVGARGVRWAERLTGGGFQLRVSLPIHTDAEDADVFDALRDHYGTDGLVSPQAEHPTWSATRRLGTTVEARVLRDEQGARVAVREPVLGGAFGPLGMVWITVFSQVTQSFTEGGPFLPLALTFIIFGVPAWLGGRVVHRYLVRRRLLPLRQLGRRLAAAPTTEADS